MKLSELQFDKNYAICVVGDAGSGKTTLAGTAPGKKYFFCFEDGLTSIAHDKQALETVEFDLYLPKPHLPLARTPVEKQRAGDYPGKSWELATAKLRELSKNCPYDVVIVDSLSSMSQVNFEAILAELDLLGKPPKADSRTAYQTLGLQSLQFFHGVLGLPCAKIMIGHETYERDETTGRLQYKISAEGNMFSSRVSTGRDFGEIWRTTSTMSSTDKGRVFSVQTQSTDKFPAKSRWGCFAAAELPDINKMMEKVYKKFGKPGEVVSSSKSVQRQQ